MDLALETGQLEMNDLSEAPEVTGPIVRQYVVVDRSLGMSAGKLAAQVAHAVSDSKGADATADVAPIEEVTYGDGE